MSSSARTAEDLGQIPRLPIYRLSVDQYHRLIETGILDEQEQVELLEGLVVRKGHDTSAPSIFVLTPGNGVWSPDQPVPVYQFTVDQYHRMIQAGILMEGDPIELLEGWLVLKMTRNPPHEVSLSLTEHEIRRRLPDDWFCRIQSAVTTKTSEPEPDVAVVRGQRRDYKSHHPGPKDMAVVVEVADSTLRQDRDFKGPLYARAGVPVYWIVNLPDERIEVYTDPSGPGPAPSYGRRRDFTPGEAIPLVLDGREVGQIPVSDLLP